MVSRYHNCLFPQQNEVATFVIDLSVMTICNTPLGIKVEALKKKKKNSVLLRKMFQVFDQKDKHYKIFVFLLEKKKERRH